MTEKNETSLNYMKLLFIIVRDLLQSLAGITRLSYRSINIVVLLHKKDALGRAERLQMKDFESVLNREAKTTRKYLKGLIDHGALIKPDKRRRFYVDPRFKIRGGYISPEEFDMLLKHDPLIKDCIDEYQFAQFNDWRILKSK